jgi:uncharacterized membrane protein
LFILFAIIIHVKTSKAREKELIDQRKEIEALKNQQNTDISEEEYNILITNLEKV